MYFGGKRVAMRTVSSGTIYYYEDDMLGTARTMVQAGQTTPCFDADFLPYGQEVDYTSTCGTNYRFEGKERDLETGDDDFGARYYRSNLGRWLSADWSAVPAPVPYANLTNPQTLNLYAMVSDNPETFADLDGHCGKVTMPGAPPDPCPNPQTSGAATLGDGQRPGDGTQKSPTQQAQQPQQPNQNDPEQQTIKEEQQQRQQEIDAMKGPALGSPEATKELVNGVASLTTSGEKQILRPAAILEAAGVGLVVGTSATAATVGGHIATAAGSANVAVFNGSVAAGAAIDTYVPGGVEAVHDFTEGALEPSKAPPSTAGLIGAAARTTVDLLIDLIRR